MIVGQGTPEAVARIDASYTGRYLRAALGKRAPARKLAALQE
jgi:excinuclease UvrABC ATPase subunit